MIGWGKGRLPEGGKFVAAIPPQDVNNAAKNSLYVGMKNHKRLIFVIQTGAIGAITDINVTLTQAKDAAGTGAKALTNDYAKKSVGQTQVDGGDAVSDVTVSSGSFTITATDDNGVFLVDIRADELDINNGFTHVRLNTSSPGAVSCLLSVLAFAYDGNHSGKESTLPSVLG